MKLSKIAIAVATPEVDPKDGARLLALLRELHVPMDPCAGDPHFEIDAAGAQRLLIVVTPAVQEKLRAAGRQCEVVRDYADVPDPRTYVSPKNRYAEKLAELRAAKRRH